MTYVKIPTSLVKSKLLKSNDKIFNLMVNGQGVFLFKVLNNPEKCVINVNNSENLDGLKFEFTQNNIVVKRPSKNETYLDPDNNSGLTNKKGAYYWISIDYQNLWLYAGIGEARIDNILYRYKFPLESKYSEESEDSKDSNTKSYLESLSTIIVDDNTQGLRLIRDPITQKVPMYVRDKDELTMDDVANNYYVPNSNLSIIGQKLYNCISGKKFELDTPDFPDFSKAIEYSIATEGCWCNEKLKEKSTEFNPDKPNILETYLRITLNQNNGESPGIPYVMEIWPVGHYSPVHNHSNANAVIRVLHGSINVSLFSYLCEEKDGLLPYAQVNFNKGDITWISPTLNQTHQLKNIGKSDTCVTIQCYMYDTDDNVHYDYFDYLDEDGNKQQYDPDSDMDFVEFKKLMKSEWDSRKTEWSIWNLCKF